MTDKPNVNAVEINELTFPDDAIFTSKTASDFCCKKNCANANVPEVLKCRKAIAKKICRKDNYYNSIQNLGQYPWMVYNLQWGNYPDYLKCFCETCGKNKNKLKNNVKDCCNCNTACNKLSKKIRNKMRNNIGYFKVYNPYQDYKCSTVDGWPPQIASPTGDHKTGHGTKTYVELVNELKTRKITGYNKQIENPQMYVYEGRLYSQYAKVPVFIKKKNKTYKVQVPCAPGARKYVPKNILGNSRNAFDFNNVQNQ